MAPKSEVVTSTTTEMKEPIRKEKYKIEIVWSNVIKFVFLHTGAVYGVYLAMFEAKLATTLTASFLLLCSHIGVTGGVHRLWSHKAYQAKLPLRTLLMIFQSMAGQNHIYEWARDHRVHHKFSETDADPHNALRGFFFSHMGWLLCKKHPDVIKKGKTLDLSDLDSDIVVTFQKKYYLPLLLLFCFILPTLIPVYLFGETVWNAYFVSTVLRYILSLHFTWLVNSAAHMWGYRPYDKTINPRENIMVSILAVGEGFHNYHHTFPWDYSASELGWKLNITTMFLDFMASIGQAYNLRTVPKDVLENRKLRTGEGCKEH